jgi:glycogen debranching enzyme
MHQRATGRARPHDAAANTVPAASGSGDLTLVDGRTFVISDGAGDLTGGTHGLVHDDRRHLSTFRLGVRGAVLQSLASTMSSPLTAVTVCRLLDDGGTPASCLIIRRRLLAGGMREDIEIRETGPDARALELVMSVGADFAHVFDVKASRHGAAASLLVDDAGCVLAPETPTLWSTLLHCEPPPDEIDPETGTLRWRVTVEPRSAVPLQVLVEPVVTDDPVDLSLLHTHGTVTAVPLHQVPGWRERVPTIVSTDPRLAPAFDQALADLAALRIIDRGHPDRVLTAAGAPWYMTLFGRDSLITSLMTLGYDAELASGVLLSLADLQGHVHDPVSEEAPGKILHELRRHGSGGPFADRNRYYGTVDATPLFVVVAREARRWGVLADDDLRQLAPNLGAAITWLIEMLDRSPFGCLCYERTAAEGLSNQGWKDSWDGVTFADGTLPEAPIALVEVQGYTYAALMGAAELGATVDLGHDPDVLRTRADGLLQRFNELFWDDRGWFVLGLDGAGRRIDALTTNPGHALWCGIADEALGRQYLDRLAEPELWNGWGLRTLASSMASYDPLSYHNGSVWPHDSTICAAAAARFGRWGIVDAVVGGLLDVASHFDGRPPELFAGLARADVPTPVAYPAACSPQAWASASVLMLVRALLGLEAEPSPPGIPSLLGISVCRTDLSGVPDVHVHGLLAPGGAVDVHVEAGRADIAGV